MLSLMLLSFGYVAVFKYTLRVVQISVTLGGEEVMGRIGPNK